MTTKTHFRQLKDQHEIWRERAFPGNRDKPKKSGAPLSERPAEGRREEIYLAAIASVFMPSARAKRPSEVRKVLSLRPLEAVSQ